MANAGDRFGEFTITASNGMSRGCEVADAVQESTQKRVRLVIFERADIELQEAARIRSRVADTRVLDVLGAGAAPLPWIAYEHPAGQTLAEIVATTGPLSVLSAHELFTQVCEALAAMHRSGLVHGALSPNTIWIERSAGEPSKVKLGDAGLGSVLGPARPTAPWTPPENARDARSDVFVLGNLVFFALVGRIGAHVPFPASASARAAQAPIALPPAFDSWFARCTEESPAFRFSDAAEARASLLLVLEDMGRVARPEPPPIVDPHPYRSFTAALPTEARSSRRPRRLVGAALLIALLVTVAGFLTFILLARRRHEDERSAERGARVTRPGEASPAGRTGMRPALTIPAHMSAVFGVALLPDRNMAVSTSFDDSVKGWNLDTGAQTFVLSPSFGKGGALAVSADGLIAAGGASGKVKLWSTTDAPKLVGEIAAHAGQVSGLAIAADAPVLFSCSLGGDVRAWRLPAGDPIRAMVGHTGRVMSVAASADGERAVSSGEDGTVRVWSLATGEALRIIRAHERPISSVRLANDGQTIATASDDGTAKLFHADSGALLRTFSIGSTEAWSVAFTPSGRTVAVGAKDGTVTLYSVFGGERLRRIEAHPSGVIALAFDASGSVLVSGGGDRVVRVWKNL